MRQTFRIEKGEVYRVTTTNNSAQVWDISGGQQPVLLEELPAGYSWDFGPYTAEIDLGVEYDLNGSASVTKLPKANVFSHFPSFAAVDDAVDAATAVTQLNELLAVLRSGGVIGADPVNDELPEITGTAQVGQTLTCSTGVWISANPILSYTYQWYLASDDSAIESATANTYVPVEGDIDDEVYCIVTANNRFGGNSATAEDSDTIIAE